MAFAVRKVVKGPGGKPHIMFMDPQTGLPIPFDEIENYDLIEQGTNLEIPSQNKDKDKETDKPSDTDTHTQNQSDNEIIKGDGWESSRNVFTDRSPYSPRSQENNFGYVDKPGWVSAIGMLPGGIGLVGKAFNSMINTNNTMAVNAARQAAGLPELSWKDTIAGSFRDNKGYVGDIVIDDQQYAIGLEAKNPVGRTTLTPTEAARRAGLAMNRNQEVRAATPQEMKAANQAFKATGYATSTGRIGIAKELVQETLGAIQAVKNDMVSPTPTTDVVSPVDQSQQTTPGGRQITPGIGLANLGPRNEVGINYQMGKNRPAPPNQDLQKAAQQAVANTFGPGYNVNITSGMPGPGMGQYGSARHNLGKALDMNVTDPDGNRVTDPAAMEALGAELGRQGIQSLGYGRGYMGPGMMHIDTVNNAAPSWGAGGRAKNADPAVRDAFLQERTPTGILPFDNVPTPTTKPDIPDAGFVDPSAGLDMMPTSGIVRGGGLASIQSKGIDPSVLSEMGRTIAGELGSETISGIRSGNPQAIETARNEIADIANTMYNRAMSQRMQNSQNPWGHIVDPRQYNSRAPNNMNQTNTNYDLVGAFINDALSDYNSGSLIGNAPNATHYRAGYVNPSWANYATNVVNSGEHIFSNVLQPGTGLQEYQRALPENMNAPSQRPSGLLSDKNFDWNNFMARYATAGSDARSPTVAAGSGGFGLLGGGRGGGYTGGRDGAGGIAGTPGGFGGSGGGRVDIGGVGIENDDGSISWGGTNTTGSWGNKGGFNGTGRNQSGGNIQGGGVTSGGKADGSKKVICGYFYNKGMLPTRVYYGDLKYATTVVNPRTHDGYLTWATPFVKWMEKKHRPIIEAIIYPLIKAWAYEMAERVGYIKERPKKEKFLNKPAYLACYSTLFALSYFVGLGKQIISSEKKEILYEK